jgi:hypothetical protein
MGMDFDDFLTASTRSDGCKLRQHINKLAASERDAVEQALSHPSVTATAIAEVLEQNGYVISPDVVQRHRREACSCARWKLAGLAASAENGAIMPGEAR